MNITTHITAGCLFIFIIACLGGCSAGGFQGSDNAPQGPAQNELLKRINGTASKGIIQNGKVSIFSLNSNGSQGPLLKTTSTNAFGIYSSSVNLTSSAGAALISVSGTYKDEATGADLAVPSDKPLRAAVDKVSGVMTIAITPLTELAVRKADVPPLRLVNGNIASANKLVSDIFKVDIINTEPLDPTAESFRNVKTLQDQKDYSLVLAAISQMSNDYYSGSLDETIATMNSDLAKGDALGNVTSGQFQAALRKFLQSDKNQTGVTDISKTNLVNAGGGTIAIKLVTSGTLQAGTSINGITVKIALPTGVTVRISDFALYKADIRAIYASGSFSSPDIATINSIGHFFPAAGSEPAYLMISALGPTSGTGLGEFLTVVCDLPAGATYSASNFSLPLIKVVGGDALNVSELQGVTVEIR